jgi:hypothetical protein
MADDLPFLSFIAFLLSVGHSEGYIAHGRRKDG